MTTFNAQTLNVFRDADPGIAFTVDDEQWTIETGVVVASADSDAVLSMFRLSTLINHGAILSTGQFNAGVDLAGDSNLLTNAEDGSVTGALIGVVLDGADDRIDNQGAIRGLALNGVDFAPDAVGATLANHGSIFGGEFGVAVFATADGGRIDNFGRIASDQDGIGLESGDGITTVVLNEAGAMIAGGSSGIFVGAGRLSLDNAGTIAGGIFLDADAAAAAIANHGAIRGVVGLGAGNDIFLGTGGSSGPVFAAGGDDVLVGGSRADAIFGDAGNDRLAGAAGNDTLDGGQGNDTLTGGPGHDQFIFEASPDSARNLDRITDFAPGVDHIVLGDRVFAHLGADGVLAAARFALGPGAADAGDRIVYSPRTGFLLYDPDGRGGAPAVHFATLAPHLALHNTDFVVTHTLLEA